MSKYIAEDGEPIPDAVIETFDEPDEWDYLDPDNVPVYSEVVDEKAYRGIVNGREQVVNERGQAEPYDYFDLLRHVDDGSVPDELGEYTYRDIDIVHHDHWAEHLEVARYFVPNETKSVVVKERSGAIKIDDTGWLDLSDDERKMLLSVYRSTPFETGEFVQVKDQMHPSDRPSDFSDKVNSIGAFAEEYGYPVVTVIGDNTGNVMTNSVEVWVPQNAVPELEEWFAG